MSGRWRPSNIISPTDRLMEKANNISMETNKAHSTSQDGKAKLLNYASNWLMISANNAPLSLSNKNNNTITNKPSKLTKMSQKFETKEPPTQ